MRFDRYGWKIVILAAALMVSHPAGVARAGGTAVQAKSKHVQAYATSTKIDAAGKQVVTLTVVIDKGWHIYANPIQWNGYETLQCEVNVNSRIKPARVQIFYPPGKVYIDKNVLPARPLVYEGTVYVQAVVSRASGDVGPLDVYVNFSACDALKCLPKDFVKVTVP